MGLRHTIRIFDSHPEFEQFKDSFSGPRARALDPVLLRKRALELAEEFEPRSDRSDLEETLAEFEVSYDWLSLRQIAPMLAFLGQTLFRDVSAPVPSTIEVFFIKMSKRSDGELQLRTNTDTNKTKRLKPHNPFLMTFMLSPKYLRRF